MIKITINKEESEIKFLHEYLFSKIFGEPGCESETLQLINTFTENNFTGLTYKPNEMIDRHKCNKKSNVVF